MTGQAFKILPYYKVIITNHVVEIYEMDRKPHVQHKDDDDYWTHFKNTQLFSLDEERREQALAEIRKISQEKSIEFKDRKAERRAQTLRDARNKCRRLAIANFNEESLFITLTVKNNIGNVEWGDNEFEKFRKRVKRRFGDFDYIAVREFQKRGAIHYHMLCNVNLNWNDKEGLRAIEREFGEEIWGHGFVDIQRLNKTKKEGKNVDNVGAYLTKYMSKEFDDERLQGKKAYLNSQGLEKPIELKGNDEEILKIIETFKQKKETFSNAYNSEHLGNINYKEYNLKRI